MVGKFLRDVSIIGVGATKCGDVRKTPEILNMTGRELFASAAQEAMEDAGIEAKDAETLYVGNLYGADFERQVHYGHVLVDWCGMHLKGGVGIDVACASSHVAVREAAFAVASGMYDIVLAGGVEILTTKMGVEYPAKATPVNPGDAFEIVNESMDQAYLYPQALDYSPWLGASPVVAYAKKYGVSIDTMIDVLDAITIATQRGAARNPKASMNRELSEYAAERGFKDVKGFLRSRYNPPMCWPISLWHFCSMTDGAAAAVVCATDIAKKYHDTPIDIMGTGLSAGFALGEDLTSLPINIEASKQAYKMAGIAPKDVELMELHDCMNTSHLVVSEDLGYFDRGESWKAFLDGRIAFDGDKPINTSGGRRGYGHPVGATGAISIYEIVKQLRGEAEKRQVKPQPEIGMIHNYGCGATCVVTILGRR